MIFNFTLPLHVPFFFIYFNKFFSLNTISKRHCRITSKLMYFFFALSFRFLHQLLFAVAWKSQKNTLHIIFCIDLFFELSFWLYNVLIMQITRTTHLHFECVFVASHLPVTERLAQNTTFNMKIESSVITICPRWSNFNSRRIGDVHSHSIDKMPTWNRMCFDYSSD